MSSSDESFATPSVEYRSAIGGRVSLVEELADEPRCVTDDGDHLLVRHPRGTEDADDAGEPAGAVLRGDDGEGLEARVEVLGADGDRDPVAGAGAAAEERGEVVARLGELEQAAQPVAGGE